MDLARKTVPASNGPEKTLHICFPPPPRKSFITYLPAHPGLVQSPMLTFFLHQLEWGEVLASKMLTDQGALLKTGGFL